MSTDPHIWPDLEWRKPRVIPPPPAKDLTVPVLNRRPDLGDFRSAGVFLVQSGAWSA